MPLDPHRTSVPQTHPPGCGWRDWLTEPPYRHGSGRLVEAWRSSWQRIDVIDLDTLHPATNIAGILWRPLSKPRLEPEVVHHAT
jgi:hypothetical protein